MLGQVSRGMQTQMNVITMFIQIKMLMQFSGRGICKWCSSALLVVVLCVLLPSGLIGDQFMAADGNQGEYLADWAPVKGYSTPQNQVLFVCYMIIDILELVLIWHRMAANAMEARNGCCLSKAMGALRMRYMDNVLIAIMWNPYTIWWCVANSNLAGQIFFPMLQIL